MSHFFPIVLQFYFLGLYVLAGIMTNVWRGLNALRFRSKSELSQAQAQAREVDRVRVNVTHGVTVMVTT